MELKEQLLYEAKRRGMCTANFKALARCADKRQALQLYFKTVDWALEHSYPSLIFLRENFADCDSEGLYVGKTFHGETFDKRQTYVFHNCRGTINVAMDYENAIIPMLYFANDCHMSIGCTQENIRAIRVPLYIFGENTVSAKDNENVQFIKYKGEVL